MKNTTLICLLDKPYPPEHSFVTGMLAQALPRDGDVRVQLLVMAPDGEPRPPTRYHRAACLPMVPDFSRGSRSRLWAMLAARRLTHVLIDKARRRGERVVLFVRNHPALMLVAASLRYRADGFIFQSSHPLELQPKSRARRFAYRNLLRLAGHRVDGVLAVSPLGLQRVRAWFSRELSGLVVPLLSDLPRASGAEDEIWDRNVGSVRFIYAGTHAARRRLDVVLAGAVAALDRGVDASFAFVGGKPKEVAVLRQSHGVRGWERIGRIRFVGFMPRTEIPKLFCGADVGLSLVPETQVNREMSPTKLSEYMGAGLAVLASRGVDLQERFIHDSGAGILVSFDASSIASGIHRIASDPEFLAACKANAECFARDRLAYTRYVAKLKALIDGGGTVSTKRVRPAVALAEDRR